MGGGWVRGNHTLNVRLRSSNNTVHAAAEQAWLCSGFVLFHQKTMQNTRTKLDSHLAPGAVELLISDCQQTKAAVCTEQRRGTMEDHTSVPCRHSPQQQPPLGPKSHRGDRTTSDSLHKHSLQLLEEQRDIKHFSSEVTSGGILCCNSSHVHGTDHGQPHTYAVWITSAMTQWDAIHILHRLFAQGWCGPCSILYRHNAVRLYSAMLGIHQLCKPTAREDGLQSEGGQIHIP